MFAYPSVPPPPADPGPAEPLLPPKPRGPLVDLLLTVVLVALEGALAVVGLYALLIRAWDTGGSTGPKPYDWVPVLAVAGFAAGLLLVTVLACRSRLPITATVHGMLLAGLLLLVAGGYAYDHRHDTRPTPLPSDYRPCFSGSNDCPGG
ncbi:DUF6234 family protein [Kitasatospora atroaurantiaca]|uniref:DUF6234 domain-containing protein n=1 Tax=Kitasatospora atroaurantiaca TaxID=285545 RepID=A0A561EQ98_9ACTN|nr:DUF6234 family protein [Kitasatospora atroaurantiaca]TWE17785.1 hypothetical protein FB465_2823 [Kitasatospora atroaurantiaca]